MRLEELRIICNNPFKITRRRDDNGNPIFFRHYRDVNNWYVGESRELLDTAYEGILLDKLGFKEGRKLPKTRYTGFLAEILTVCPQWKGLEVSSFHSIIIDITLSPGILVALYPVLSLTV